MGQDWDWLPVKGENIVLNTLPGILCGLLIGKLIISNLQGLDDQHEYAPHYAIKETSEYGVITQGKGKSYEEVQAMVKSVLG